MKNWLPLLSGPALAMDREPVPMLQGIPLGLVGELVAGPAAARAGRVSALDDEIGDHPVKGDPVIESFPSQENGVVHRLGACWA